MSVIKSVSVGYGDLFYVRHNSDNFTILDCMLPPDDFARRKIIVDELIEQSADKGVIRFISTHPDQDHLWGLRYLDSRMGLRNFYCVKNAVMKDDPTDDFLHYCTLRGDPEKVFYIYKGCSRRWMNQTSEERGSSGINILWPDTSNADYRAALAAAERGESPNNTSAIIKYSLNDGVTALWMGDLETGFMEAIEGALDLPKVDLLFAPHHGRKTGRVPDSWLERLNPTVIVLGQAPTDKLHYYPEWNTLSQNPAGDISFDCLKDRVDVYVYSSSYTAGHLYDAGGAAGLGHYVGSFDV